jgi:hypothetical protein
LHRSLQPCSQLPLWLARTTSPAWRFPVQHEIQQLQKEPNDFNQRIIELQNEGHRGHAMKVLKARAMDFARQIDELRCLLIELAVFRPLGSIFALAVWGSSLQFRRRLPL